jgi:TonB family protein
MKENRLGILFSVTVHACVIPLLVAASFSAPRGPIKVVEVDFSLLKEEVREYPAREARKEGTQRRPRIRGGSTPKRMVGLERPDQVNQGAVPPKEHADPPPAPTIVTASDAQGETVVPGLAASYADSSMSDDSHRTYGSGAGTTHGSGQGGGPGGQGGGQGSGHGTGEGLTEGSRDYTYIRDAVMRNVRYPEEALRSGIEGKVLLSFIVLENGATSKIQVVSTSGSRLLDQSAREAVALTRIGRKVPYRVVVHLPVVYKLQGVKG